MNVVLISLLIGSLALASLANVVPPKEQNLEKESSTLENSNVTSSAQNVTTATTNNVGEALTELLTSFKNVMSCGNSTYGLGQLSPYRKAFIKVNFSGEHLALKGEIENLVITGLDDFLIIELSSNASTNRTKMDIIYKDIQILGNFNLKVEADLAGFKYTQPLKGYMNLQILDSRTQNSLTIGQNEVGGIQLSNVEHSFQIGDIIVNNLNTEWSVAVNNFANQYIRDFVMLSLQTNREIFGKIYSEFATAATNKALYNIPYSSLASSLADSIKILKSMEC